MPIRTNKGFFPKTGFLNERYFLLLPYGYHLYLKTSLVSQLKELAMDFPHQRALTVRRRTQDKTRKNQEKARETLFISQFWPVPHPWADPVFNVRLY